MHPLRLGLARVFLVCTLVGVFLGGPALRAGATPDITITCTGTITLTPDSGPAGSTVYMQATGLCIPVHSVFINFTDASGRSGTLKTVAAQEGTFSTKVRIPYHAALGTGTVSVSGVFVFRFLIYVDKGSANFDVT